MRSPCARPTRMRASTESRRQTPPHQAGLPSINVRSTDPEKRRVHPTIGVPTKRVKVRFRTEAECGTHAPSALLDEAIIRRSRVEACADAGDSRTCRGLHDRCCTRQTVPFGWHAHGCSRGHVCERRVARLNGSSRGRDRAWRRCAWPWHPSRCSQQRSCTPCRETSVQKEDTLLYSRAASVRVEGSGTKASASGWTRLPSQLR